MNSKLHISHATQIVLLLLEYSIRIWKLNSKINWHGDKDILKYILVCVDCIKNVKVWLYVDTSFCVHDNRKNESHTELNDMHMTKKTQYFRWYINTQNRMDLATLCFSFRLVEICCFWWRFLSNVCLFCQNLMVSYQPVEYQHISLRHWQSRFYARKSNTFDFDLNK